VTIEQLLAIQGISGKVVDNATWEVLWSLARPLPASPNTNLLTANQSSIETDATGWTVESGGTIARSTVESYVGSASLEITTTGAIAAVALVATTPVETASVVVGETYRASVYFVADQVFLAAVVISWRDSDGNEISQVQGNTAVIYPQDGWTQRTAEGVAPANATNPVVRLRVVEPYTNANIHYADAISLRHVDE
jgi:hypothetical protein